jgi:dihydropteroate synthase
LGGCTLEKSRHHPGMLTLRDLAELAERHGNVLDAKVASFSLAGQKFDFNRETHLMGVVNLSPQSWYRESVSLSAEAAVRRGQILLAQGASLVDVGAESSLAHADRVGEEAQRSALLPVVKELAKTGACVSVETYCPKVATACLEAGARVLNLTGTDRSERLFREVAAHEAGVIICYVQGANVREVGDLDLEGDPIGFLYEFFARQIELAEKCGVRRIWVDPGLGFYYRNLQDSAIRIRHQMEVFLGTFRLRALGWPTCHALPHAFECFEEEVRSAEPFFAVLALLGKTDLLRTHEVAKVRGVAGALRLFGAPS